MKGNVFLYCLALIFLATPVFGAIEPPYKEIEYCYRIDNISAYPDFVLIARFPFASEGYGYPIQLKEDECYARNTRDEIVAMRKESSQAPDMEAGIFNSGIRTPVSPVKIYDPQDPRKKIEDIFTIDALGGQTFSLRLAKKIITLDDGTSKEKVYATAEEGLADPPGPGYEYTDAQTNPVLQPSDIIRPDHIDWRESLWIKSKIVLDVFGIISLVAFFLSGGIYMFKKTYRSRCKNIMMISLLSLIFVVMIYAAFYYYIDTLKRGFY